MKRSPEGNGRAQHGRRQQAGVDAGAENLSRRGEDARFDEQRPAARRRRAIDEAMPERGEAETRADVARRLDSTTDRQPDWVAPDEDDA